jgi:hypothetical protein
MVLSRTILASTVFIAIFGLGYILILEANTDTGNAGNTATMGTTLCQILTTLEPTMRPGDPLDAQTKWEEALVKAFTDNAFNRKKMAQVKAEVDKLTTAGCPKERKAMLKHLDADTLGETVF